MSRNIFCTFTLNSISTALHRLSSLVFKWLHVIKKAQQCFQTSNFVWRCRQGLTRSLGGRVESCASADPIAIESATSLTQRKGRKLTTSWADDKSRTAERCPAMRIHASLPPVSFGISYPCLHSKTCGSGPTVSCDFPCVNIVDILLNCTFFFFYLKASS